MAHDASALVAADDLSDADRVRHVTIHGYKRAYILAGSGPAILLIHGIGDNADTWRGLIADLARDHLVIAPDLLGHGRSDRPRADYSIPAYACGMRDLLSVLNIEKVTVVGHSLGGGVAMQFAYQFPERCERIVLVSTGGGGRKTTPLLQLMAIPGAGVMLPIMRLPGFRHSGTLSLRMLRLLGTNIGQDAEDMIKLFDAWPDRTSRSAFVRTLRAVMDRQGQVVTLLDRCYLAKGMPTLLIWGERDAVIPVAHAQVVHEAMPGSRLEIFANAAHFPHHSDPERFLSVLRDFLATTQPAEYSVAQWRALLRAGRDGDQEAALENELRLDDAMPFGV